jgi:1-acyl-sn-glycerol-3-phosphate acyltransferase
MMSKVWYVARQTVYTLFAFCYFLGMSFVLTVRGFFLLTLRGVSDVRKLKYHALLQRQAHFVINRVPGTTFDYVNKVGETFERPSIIICNHQSHLDLMAVMMLTPKLIILTKSWVWHNPFYGGIIRYADYLPVGDTEMMEKDLKTMVEKGYSVMVFPEGTRSEDCSIHRFHRGAFYLAEQFDLDIVPVVIKGFGTVLPKKSWCLHPGKMTLEVMPRIRRGSLEWNCDYREMTRRVYQLYVKKLSVSC